MKESEITWLKIASFVGALVLLVLAFVMVSGGVYLIGDGHTLHGVATIIGGLLSVVGAVVVYKNYQKKSDEIRYGKQ